MNKYEVFITQNAVNDINEIENYFIDELLQPNAFYELINKIENTLLSLEEMPFMFQLVNDQYLLNKSIRKIPIDKYIIFYTVREKENSVFIIRVLYQKRNWINLI